MFQGVIQATARFDALGLLTAGVTSSWVEERTSPDGPRGVGWRREQSRERGIEPRGAPLEPGRRRTSLAGAHAADVAFWHRATGGERLQAVWELAVEWVSHQTPDLPGDFVELLAAFDRAEVRTW